MNGDLVKEALRLTNELQRGWRKSDDPVLISLVGELKRVMVKLNEDISAAAPSAIGEEIEGRTKFTYKKSAEGFADGVKAVLDYLGMRGRVEVIKQADKTGHVVEIFGIEQGAYGESSVVLKEANRYRRALVGVKLMLGPDARAKWTVEEIVGRIIEPVLAGQEPITPDSLEKTGRWASDRVNRANAPKKRSFEDSAKLYGELKELAKKHDICIVTAKAPPPTSEPWPNEHGLLIIDYLDKLEG